jgi:hypothetical protein
MRYLLSVKPHTALRNIIRKELREAEDADPQPGTAPARRWATDEDPDKADRRKESEQAAQKRSRFQEEEQQRTVALDAMSLMSRSFRKKWMAGTNEFADLIKVVKDLGELKNKLEAQNVVKSLRKQLVGFEKEYKDNIRKAQTSYLGKDSFVGRGPYKKGLEVFYRAWATKIKKFIDATKKLTDDLAITNITLPKTSIDAFLGAREDLLPVPDDELESMLDKYMETHKEQ